MHNNAPERFSPWGVPSVVVRPAAVPPCTTSCRARAPHCIRGVSPSMVLEAAATLIRPVSPRATDAAIGVRA